jgi:hypothetical protein
MEFKWKTSFTLLNVVLERPISLDGVEIRTHPRSSPDSPKVSITYRFSTTGFSPDIHLEAKEAVEKFLDLTIINAALSGCDERKVMEEFEQRIENPIELERAGVNVPIEYSYKELNRSIWNEEYVQSILDWLKKFEAHKDSEIVHRTLRLLRQSILEEDEYDRLSKAWRSFNALYNHLSGAIQTGEPKKIKNFVSCLHAKNSSLLKEAIEEYWTPLPKPTRDRGYLPFILVRNNWVSAMDCLVKQNFIHKQRTNHSQNLALAMSKKDLRAALESALLCVYAERNRILHGEVISENERHLLYICAAFLQRIVGIALTEFYFFPLQAIQSFS